MGSNRIQLLLLVVAATFSFTNAKLEKQCGCFPDWVQCDNGKCIPKSKVCDGYLDCQQGHGNPDRSDEADCSPCPAGFTHLRRINGCYKLVRDNLDWNIAGLRCKALHKDAYLLVVNNAAEQQAISTWMTSYSDADVAGCTRFTATHSCKAMFWTAGQRYDLAFRPSPFIWKKNGSHDNGPGMSEMTYTYWNRNEPNDASSRDWQLKPVTPPASEKCMQLCRGWGYTWNDAVCEIPMCSICEVDARQ